jgi:hypothetical protein
MKQWTKPAFEEFDVNGECTAYAGAERAETLARETRPGAWMAARRESLAAEPAAAKSSTPSDLR